MMLRTFACIGLFASAVTSFAQWSDRRFVGAGGETCISSDGKGNVYATSHLPSKLWLSRDWGNTWSQRFTFNDSCCDMVVLGRPNGKVNVTYLFADLSGISTYYSSDYGATLTRGTAPRGSLDREWFGVNPINGELYMDYSNGYIGGPRSIGVFCAASTDDGHNFVQRGRCDNDGNPNYPVDPYLAVGSGGRIYAMWTTSADYDTIDRFKVSVSNDGGQTFTNHQVMADLHKTLGDTQERWMLGSIVAVGRDTAFVLYPDYEQVTVDGQTYRPLLQHYRFSRDGGVTWSTSRTVSSAQEIADSIRSFNAGRLGNVNFPYYIQTLSWACADSFEKLHVIWQDNRAGQGLIGGTPYDKWHVRHTIAPILENGFVASERVSPDVIMKRPPLDFIGCCADRKYFYAIWVENPGQTSDWAFSGNIYVGRKKLVDKPATGIGQ